MMEINLMDFMIENPQINLEDIGIFKRKFNLLEETMKDYNISFEKRTLLQGVQYVFEDGSDIICHTGSYGWEDGLFESYNMPQDCDDVTGNLDIDEVIERLLENGLSKK